MDSTITAALIAMPSAVIASVAAYAVGRAQARAAHRGPIEAVRRQHQHEVCAAFHAAITAYDDALKAGMNARSRGPHAADFQLSIEVTGTRS
ncbi:hypothetical protein AB0O76_02660 [Streptomyces sp. NPDC086554]|uniref:hypothetical protein n=1 Tax=Streptomyces sp. NPDC086554 TaxID=3154864 RepID=UPI003435CB26